MASRVTASHQSGVMTHERVPLSEDLLRNLVAAQLPEYYRRIGLDKDQSLRIRNWCITVWLATIMLPLTDKVHLTTKQATTLLLLA